MQDAWRAYLEMALGLTEAPRKKAQKVAGELLSKGGATAGQLQGLVEDLLATGVANREALTNIVRYEVDRALGLVGLATADEVSDLTARVRDLEKQLKEARARAGAAAGDEAAADLTIAEPGPVSVVPPARKAPVTKVAGKKAVKPATPNAMPAAASPAAPVRKAAKKATPATTGPAKAAPAKAVPAKATKVAKAARKAAKATAPGTEPAGTAAAPTAPVKAAAAETVLPPAKSGPAKTLPAKDAPAKAASAKATRAKAASARSTRAKATPAKGAAAKAAPVKAAPAKSTPVKTTPAKSTPVKTTPAKSAPAQKVTGTDTATPEATP
ncbi:phasin family protein [Couchioplanes azureus]|uniref:phasin family protein n=1 Tax=Couchioplanes caeruleus TaxID=56438 RepID=UPI0019C5DE14|nr:hypothetical protein [Couchioplanes caeruleus]GGQ86959.1 hypothetical protein GCM10010166_66430 [Couchioplanes caeruleus subsp. azureus]